MSILPNVGNPQDAGGSDAKPIPSTEGSQPLEGNLPDLITKLQRKLDEQASEINALKAGKDKALDRIEKAQKDTFARIAQYLNVDEEKVREAQRNLVLDDLVKKELNNPQSSPVIAGTVIRQDRSAELDVDSVLKKLKFDENDAALEALKIKHRGNPQGLIEAAADLRYAQLTSPSPSPATGFSQTGKVVQTDTLQALQTEYEERKKKIQRGNILGLSNLQAEMRKKGLNV